MSTIDGFKIVKKSLPNGGEEVTLVPTEPVKAEPVKKETVSKKSVKSDKSSE